MYYMYMYKIFKLFSHSTKKIFLSKLINDIEDNYILIHRK